MVLAEVRARIEASEERFSPLAAKSRYTRGRARSEPPCAVRTAFQRDRDRIIHCKAFRRLKHKMQVFLAPVGDHYTTRLTHTLEVSQVGRSIARALNLNEDLAEAIALGHDLGHTPFGHTGEEALDGLCAEGFRHAEQSLRVIDRLERDGQGLNLTWEVRDGIAHHYKPRDSISAEGAGLPHTLEGQIIRTADSIAYLNHDIADAVRAGFLREEELPPLCQTVLGRHHSERINTMVCDVVEASWRAVRADEESRGQTAEDYFAQQARIEELAESNRPLISFSPRVLEAADLLREFMFERVYRDCDSRLELQRARHMLQALFARFREHPQEMPEEYFSRVEQDGCERVVCDYVSGMTDQYALRAFEELPDCEKMNVLGCENGTVRLGEG